jgi:hypothetical protein
VNAISAPGAHITPSLGVGTGVGVWGGASCVVGNGVAVTDGVADGVADGLLVGVAVGVVFVISATALMLGVSCSKVGLGVSVVADGSHVGLGVAAVAVRSGVGLVVAVRLGVELGVSVVAVRSGVELGVSVVADGSHVGLGVSVVAVRSGVELGVLAVTDGSGCENKGWAPICTSRLIRSRITRSRPAVRRLDRGQR